MTPEELRRLRQRQSVRISPIETRAGARIQPPTPSPVNVRVGARVQAPRVQPTGGVNTFTGAQVPRVRIAPPVIRAPRLSDSFGGAVSAPKVSAPSLATNVRRHGLGALGEAVGGLGDSLLRFFPRAAQSAANTLARSAGGPGTLYPNNSPGLKGKIERVIFGSKPVGTASDLSKEIRGGVGSDDKQWYDALIGGALLASDLVPGVDDAARAVLKGFTRQGLEQVAKEGSEQVIKKAVKKANPELADDVADRIAKRAKDTSDPNDVVKIITEEVSRPTVPRVRVGKPRANESVLHIPELGVFARVTAKQQDVLRNELDNIPWSQTDRPHLTPLSVVKQNADARTGQLSKEVTQEELAKLSPNVNAALKNLSPQQAARVEKAVDAATAPPQAVSNIDEATGEILDSESLKVIDPQTNTYEVTNAVFEALPKSIRQKVELNQPLTAEDFKVVSKTLKSQGQAANQLSLGIDEVSPRQFRVLEGVATRTTPTGKVKSVAAGQQAIPEEFAKLIETEAIRDPSRVAGVIEKHLGRSPKDMRNLISNIQSIRRRNPELAGAMEDFLYRPIIELSAASDTLVKGMRRQVEGVMDEFGRPSARDNDVLVAALDGEMGSTLQDISTSVARAADNPELVQRLMVEMRDVYDNALGAVNEQRIAAGLDPVAPRQDYFPHMKQLLNEGMFTKPLITSDPDYIRRLGTTFGFGKQRTGDMKNIERDALKVMDVYLAATEGQVRSLVPSRNFDLFEKTLKEIGDKTGKNTRGWSEWARKIRSEITGGNSVDNIVTRLQGRLAAGTVILNPGSTLKNLIQPVIAAGITRTSALPALKDTLLSTMSALRKGHLDDLTLVDGMDSSYLKSALAHVDRQQLAKRTARQATGDAFAQTFYATDTFGRKFIVEAFYNKAKASGLDPKDALRAAERQAEFILPSRAPGTLAPITRDGTLARAMNLFQTEVVAQAESLIDVGRAGGTLSKTGGDAAKNVAGIALGAYLFNSVYQELFPGQTPAPDPIRWVTNSIDAGQEAEEGDNPFVEGALEFTRNLGAQLPYVGSYFGEFSRSPLSIPIASVGGEVAKDAGALLSNEGDGYNAVRLGRNLSPFAGRGGKPIYRAGEGVVDFLRGEKNFGTDPEGNVNEGFEIEQTPAELSRSVVGGTFNTRSAQEYFNEEEKPKANKQQDDSTLPSSLSPEMQKFYKMNLTEKRQAIKNGELTQKQFDNLRALERAEEVRTGKREITDFPKGLKSKYKEVIQYNNNLTKERGQPTWTGRGVDKRFKPVTDEVNSSLPKGAPKLKATNDLALEYARLQEKNAGEDSFKKETNTRNFLKTRYITEQSKGVQDIWEAQIGQLEDAISSNRLDKKALNEAIALDDMLYSTGISKTLKFSKRFRGELGYGLPSNYSSGSGRAKVKSIRAKRLRATSGTKTAPPPRARVTRRRRLARAKIPSAPSNNTRIRIKL